MQQKASFLHPLRHNDKLPIRIVSPQFGHLSPAEAAGYEIPRHLPYYLFIFMLDGRSWHTVDLRTYDTGKDEMLFVMPYQTHDVPLMEQDADYIKLGFDGSCLSLLPRQYAFLIDSLNCQKVQFSRPEALRVKTVLAMLLELLTNWHTPPELILAHLNTLLTEIDTAYFSRQEHLVNSKISKFVSFKAYIEDHLTDQPSIGAIAKDLGMNTNALYQLIVKYAGVSPKTYITNRLILEARRRIYHAESITIKELAFDLGFNDPDHFSRLFKKVTGQSIAQFSKDLSGY